MPGAIPRVLFLYTGGTLGMRSENPGPLAPHLLAEDILAYLRGLEREVHIEAELLCNLDSSDLTPAHWTLLAGTVASRLGEFDGFVIVHGTDTMAWTASALSFLLRGLDRPVVLTGAQRPIALVRTDARTNLIHAALCAGMAIPEVCICFGRWLFRGNRATKTSIESYEAFESPDLPPLLEMGVEVRATTPPLEVPGPFQLRQGFDERVAVLQVTPGSSPVVLDSFVAGGGRGVVLRGFGSGNVPRNGWPDAIRRATDQGVAVAIHSQCLRGTVDLRAYEGGRAALDAGGLPTGSMTMEAATVKLMHLLAQPLAADSLRAAYATDLAGEGSSGMIRS
ncbi:MAG: asparaginase [Chthoniobacteraceae bacterium]